MLALAAVLFGIVNFLAFISSDARNSYEREGRYFLGAPGRYREVAKEEWERSRFHARSVFVTHPLAIAAVGYLMFAYVFPAFMGQVRPNTSERVDRVRASGPRIASTSCSGRIGMVNVSGPLIRVSAFPLGLIIKPIFTQPRAILASEILSLKPGRILFTRAMTIHHTAPDLQTPITLYVAEDSPLAKAMQELSATNEQSPEG